MIRGKRIDDLSNIVWTFDLNSGLKSVLKYLSSNLDINRAVIYTYSEKTDTIFSELVFFKGTILMGDEEIHLDRHSRDKRIASIIKKTIITTSTFIYVPINVDNKIYGLLTVDRSISKVKFNTREITFIKKVAKFIGSGLYQEKLVKDRDDRIKQLNILLKISSVLNTGDRSHILEYIGDTVIKYGKFDRVRIFIKENNDTYICKISESIIKRKTPQVEKFFTYDFFKESHITDIHYITELEGALLPLGFIEVDNIISQVKLEPEQINFLKIIASQLAMSLSNIALLDELKLHSTTDPLTGVYNYRYLMKFLKNEVSRAKRFDLKFSILMIDVDNFKEINDTGGHLMGDQVLKDLTASIKKISRDIDIVSRYGGDEFVVVTPNTGLENAAAYGKKILSASPVIKLKNKRKKVGLSIGVSTYPDDSSSIQKLFKIADSRLYTVKEAGKNQVGYKDV